MQTTLILTATTKAVSGPRRNAIAAAVQNSAAELERDIKENIQRSVPAGKTYRRNAIVRSLTKKRAGLGLTRRGSGEIVGYYFHRASRAGQPPAIDTARLINSIRAERTGELKAEVNTSVQYAAVLDDPAGLDRPFFHSRAELFRAQFLANIQAAANGE